MDITVQGYTELENKIQSLIKYVKNPLGTFKFARLVMLQDVFDHFRREESPEGAWPPLKILGMSKSGKIIKYRTRQGKLLQDSGRLRESTTGLVTHTGAEVGTNVVYAPTHQFGYPPRNIPPRTFIWLSERAQERIVNQFVKDVGDGIG